ncbi:MAG: sugar transferase [Eubacterium sp.]|nr:sugar transferase [Eubacterium sp.]
MKRFLKIIAAVLTITWVISEVISVVELISGKRGWSKHHKPYGIYERLIKRPLDIFISLIALLLLWPVMLIIALLVRVKLGSPVLFTQERPGLIEDALGTKDEGMDAFHMDQSDHASGTTQADPTDKYSDDRIPDQYGGRERIFKLYKFRTMTDERDENGELLPDEVRLTKFGAWLRSTSLDELPELINILKGDMSLVGPRPLLIKYIPRYSDEQRHRHDVRPGLTGLAQVNGRNSITWQQKFADDVEYVNHITFHGDVKIVMQTVKSVINKEGISSDTSATMEAFEGNEEA